MVSCGSLWIFCLLQIVIFLSIFTYGVPARRLLRSVAQVQDEYRSSVESSAEFIWSTTTVALGDTAVLHCSFDAIFQQLRTGNINWLKETTKIDPDHLDKHATLETDDDSGTWIANGKKILVDDSRLRVYRPRHSALSVLIIRGAKQRDAGVYRCNLSGSTTRHKYMILNVTESKIEAQTSPTTLRARIGSDVTLWCNATGYPKPVVYWTRADRNRKLPDGNYQFWGNGLLIKGTTEQDTGVYACFLDNFVQPIVSYKFSLMVQDNPWSLEGYRMRFNSKQWYTGESIHPTPHYNRSYLLMCEVRGDESWDQRPVLRWYRNDHLLRNGRYYYIIDNSVQKSGHVSSTLIIINFQDRFEGNYTCVASNVYRMKKLTFSVQGNSELLGIDHQEDRNLDNMEKFVPGENHTVLEANSNHLQNEAKQNLQPENSIYNENSNSVRLHLSQLKHEKHPASHGIVNRANARNENTNSKKPRNVIRLRRWD